MPEQKLKTVLIITPSYNNLAGLVRLAGSLERLTWPKEQIKLCICDDGSTDKTVKTFQNLKFNFEIEVLSLPLQSGPAKARNLGLAGAKADLILFLDSDLEAAPDLIERHMDCYAQPDVLAVRGENQTPKFVQKSKWFRYLDSQLRGPRKVFARTGENTITYKEVNTNNFSFRGSALTPDLRFDENIIFYGGEDMIFAYTLSQKNPGRMIYAPSAMTYHQHRSFRGTMKKLEEYGEKTIPYLLETYPQTYPDLVISRFVSPDGAREKLLWSRIIFNPLGYFLARAIRLVTPDFISFRAIQYIMAWHVLRGYRRRGEGSGEKIENRK